MGKFMPQFPVGLPVDVESISNDKLAVELAKELAQKFNVTLKVVQTKNCNVKTGSIRCQYCGQMSHNLDKCDHCSGVPI